ncbi:uncharacterized protein LOC106156465 [Lingula anatina]|uniref:Uncharacterized protein LOC106156465 n=1 Tax=Lingula anatina TaxID=7574 RepID=A0A1S3HNR8_LINAN|nr:uncharacterized protein LOC106156465 [Lingula anatina]|eukprot:XP_013387176.1 uncharacterized protein LOC106156465 [Lingula anatina]
MESKSSMSDSLSTISIEQLTSAVQNTVNVTPTPMLSGPSHTRHDPLPRTPPGSSLLQTSGTPTVSSLPNILPASAPFLLSLPLGDRPLLIQDRSLLDRTLIPVQDRLFPLQHENRPFHMEHNRLPFPGPLAIPIPIRAPSMQSGPSHLQGSSSAPSLPHHLSETSGRMPVSLPMSLPMSIGGGHAQDILITSIGQIPVFNAAPGLSSSSTTGINTGPTGYAPEHIPALLSRLLGHGIGVPPITSLSQAGPRVSHSMPAMTSCTSPGVTSSQVTTVDIHVSSVPSSLSSTPLASVPSALHQFNPQFAHFPHTGLHHSQVSTVDTSTPCPDVQHNTTAQELCLPHTTGTDSNGTSASDVHHSSIQHFDINSHLHHVQVSDTVGQVASSQESDSSRTPTPEIKNITPSISLASGMGSLSSCVTPVPSITPSLDIVHMTLIGSQEENSQESHHDELHEENHIVGETTEKRAHVLSHGDLPVSMALTIATSAIQASDKENQNTHLLSPTMQVLEYIIQSQDTSLADSAHHATEGRKHGLIEEDSNEQTVQSLQTFYCVECNCTYESSCSKHGGEYIHVLDTPVLSRARASLPAQLSLQSSRIQFDQNSRIHFDLGVWSSELIPKKTKFGPVVGNLAPLSNFSEDADLSPPFFWKIHCAEECNILMCTDEDVSNWTMFLKRAKTNSDQNLTAYQEGESIFFVTCKDIQPGSELAFWYSREYCKELGVTLSPEGAFLCDICNKQLVDSKALAQHIKYIHADSFSKKHKCQVCSKGFPNRFKLDTHMLIHMGLKPHQCRVCHKQFADASNLRMHRSIHTGEKKFSCPHCDRTFRQKAHLTSHLITHTGERKLKCSYCSKMFARSSDLKTHEYVHTKERVFNCLTCNKQFFKLQNLKKHMLVHTGIKDFQCDLCGRQFAQKHHLTRHKPICTGQKPQQKSAKKENR